MMSTNEQILEKILRFFNDIDKEEQMYMAIELIVAISNEAGSSYCESVGIIESAKSELRELLNKTPSEKKIISFDGLLN